MTTSESLAAATAAYQHAFGHAVPPDVVTMYSLRPGPLMMEIRQAVALQKPVPAWLARSRMPSPAAQSDWPFSGPVERGSLARNSGE